MMKMAMLKALVIELLILSSVPLQEFCLFIIHSTLQEILGTLIISFSFHFPFCVSELHHHFQKLDYSKLLEVITVIAIIITTIL